MKKKFSLLLCLFAFTISFAFSQATVYKTQTVYIYNFTKYINWKSTGDEFVIGVYGSSGILNEMQTVLKGKVVGVKPIVIKHITSFSDLANCSIAYISADKSNEASHIISSVKSKGVLIVAEDDLSKNNASISFIQINNKLRFKIRQQALQDAGLQVSDMLLSQGIIE